jgi:hypothetical protein
MKKILSILFLFCAVSVCGQTINTTIAAVDTVESGEKFKN